MRPAYEWTCEECGRDQFVKCEVADIHPDDAEQFAADNDLDIDPDELREEGMFVTYPDEVTCQFCGETFDTEHFTE